MTSKFKKGLSALLAVLMVMTPVSASLAEEEALEFVEVNEPTEVSSVPEPEPEPAPEREVEELIPEDEMPPAESEDVVVEDMESSVEELPQADAAEEVPGMELPTGYADEAEQSAFESAQQAPAVVAEPVYAINLDVSSITNPVYVPYGTQEGGLPLPVELPAELSDGSVETVAVVWYCTGNTYDGQGYIPECADREAVFYFQATPVGIDCSPSMLIPAVTVMYEPQPEAAAIDHAGINFAGTDILIASEATVSTDDILNETGYDASYRIVNEGTITAGASGAVIENPVQLLNGGAIRGGTFEGKIEIISGTISGGSFSGRIECKRGTISGGSFTGSIGGPERQIYVSINGGEFRGDIGDSEYDGYIFIHGGDFYCNIQCRNLTVDGNSTFYNANGKGGARRTVTLGTVGAIAGGTFYADVLNRNNIIGGTFYGKVTNGGTQKNCNVLGGTFYGEFDNSVGGYVNEYGEGGARFMNGAQLSNSSVLNAGDGVSFAEEMVVTNEGSGIIESGNYPCRVVNYGTIAGGNFGAGVINMGNIRGGTFDGEMYNEGGTIAGAKINGLLMSNTGKVTLDGLVVDDDAKTVTIAAGNAFTTDEIIGSIGGNPAEYVINNEGEITGGSAALPCAFAPDSSLGKISGGTYSAAVYANTITGGSFSAAVDANAISGGSFSGAVNANAISNGSFSGRVAVRDNIDGGNFSASSTVTAGMINAGTFDGQVTSAGREKLGVITITGGTFNGGVATAPDDGAVINGGTFNCNVGYCVNPSADTYDGYVIVRSKAGVAAPQFNGSYVGGRNVVVECGTFSKDTKVVVYTVGVLAGGTYNGPVICNNAITGGEYRGEVTINSQPNGQIHGGTFYGRVNNKEGAAIAKDENGNCKAQFLEGEIINEGNMDPGAGAKFGSGLAIVNKPSGNIRSGVYSSPVVNYGAISNGVFKAPVRTYNSIAAEGPTFEDFVIDVPAATVTIPKDATKTIPEIKALEGYGASSKIINYGTIVGGSSDSLPNEVENRGTIQGGTFDGTVKLIGLEDGALLDSMSGRIKGGTFNGKIQSYYGVISGGTFNGKVVMDGDTLVVTITGGTFNETVGTSGSGYVFVYRADGATKKYGKERNLDSSGAVFHKLVAARNLNITCGTFYGPVEMSTVGVIENGLFKGQVTCHNNIMGGEFCELVNVCNGQNSHIEGGFFHKGTRTESNASIKFQSGTNGSAIAFDGGEIVNDGILDPGEGATFGPNVAIRNTESGRILSGVYRGNVVNYGMISNATIYGSTENHSRIVNSELLGEVSGAGTQSVEGVKVEGHTITIESGYAISASQFVGLIPSGANLSDYTIVNNGTIKQGAASIPCAVEGGTISGGTYTGVVCVRNISDGNFSGTACAQTISGGSFSASAKVFAKAISGGTFRCEVHDYDSDSNGSLPADVKRKAAIYLATSSIPAEKGGLSISGGSFEATVGGSGEPIFITGGSFESCKGLTAWNLTVSKSDRIHFGSACGVSFVTGDIAGGVFDGSVTSQNNVTGGTFNGRLVNRGTIYGGTFNGGIDNYGTISGNVTYNFYADGWQYNWSKSQWEPKGTAVSKRVTDSDVHINCTVSNYPGGVINGTVAFGDGYRLDDRGGKCETSALVATPAGESKVYSGAQILCGASVKQTLAAIDAAERTNSKWSYLSGASISDSAVISADPTENAFLRDFTWDVRNGELQLGMNWSEATAVPKAEYSSVRILDGVTVSGGTWNVPVVNEGTITGGTFNQKLTNRGSVSGARINGAIVAEAGIIENCTYGSSASVTSVSGGASIRVSIYVDGNSRAANYGANALSALKAIQNKSGYDWYSISGTAAMVKSTDTIPLTGGRYELRKRPAPEIIWPTASPIGVGEPLASSTLTSTDPNGTFRWQNSSLRFNTAGTAYSVVVFTPNSNNGYNYSGIETTNKIPVEVRENIITIAVNSSYKFYSTDDPTNWSAKVTGCKTDADQRKLSYRIVREAGEDVGRYELTAEVTGKPENYIVNVIPSTFEIRAKEFSTFFRVSMGAVHYTGEALNPIPTVEDLLAHRTLEYGKDFTVSFDKQVLETGVYGYTVKGMGNYTGSKRGELSVALGNAVVTIGSYTKIVGEPDPEFTSTCSGVSEKAGFSYELYRIEGESVGTYSILARKLSGDSVQMKLNGGTLRILPQPLPADVTAPADQTYTGRAIEPKPSVMNGSAPLKEGVDYTLRYENNTNAGTASVTVVGKGSYSGETTVNFTIRKANATIAANAASKVYGAADPALTATVTGAVNGERLNYTLSRTAGEAIGTYAIQVKPGVNLNYNVTVTGSELTIAAKPVPATITVPGGQTYAGKALAPKPVVRDGGRTLAEGTDYTLRYANNVNAGTASVTVTGMGNYSGERTVEFAINKASATIAANAASKIYGSADPVLTATVTGAVNGEALKYTLSRAAGEGIGTYTINVLPGSNPNYSVTVRSSVLTIEPQPLRATIAPLADQPYAGKALEPKPVVKDGAKLLTEGVDYTLDYENNVNAGTATVKVTGKGNYGGERTVSFAIRKVDATIAANAASKVFGTEDPVLTATVTGAVNGETLKYTLSRAAGENIGTYAIQVQPGANPNYNVTVAGSELTIAAQALSATITVPGGQIYTGKALEPKPVVKDGGRTLAEGADYTLRYANNINAGTANVTVTGKGNYSGVRTVEFAIGRASATIAADAASKIYGAADPALTATVTGAVNGETLSYTLKRAEGEDAGSYAIDVQPGGNPNYDVAVRSGTLTIRPRTLQVAISVPDGQIYAGKAIEPKPVVTEGKKTLAENTDYTLRYDNNVNAGTAAVIVSGTGNYTGEQRASFEIGKRGAQLKIDSTARGIGGKDPEFTAQAIGLAEGDSLNYTLEREPGEEGGSYEITAVLGDNPNYDVTVIPGTMEITLNPEQIELSADALELKDGESGELDYALLPEGTQSEVTYSSSDDSVAQVDADGNIEALKPGAVTITATTANDKTDTCELTVLPVAEEVLIGSGDKRTMTIEGVDAADCSFTSSETSVATVDAKGVVTAKKEGAANITASAGGVLLAEWNVNVTAAPKKVILSATKQTLGVDDQFQLEAQLDQGASEISWTTSNAKIATVSEDGLITAVKAGSATITAATYNKKVKATCKVTVKKAATTIQLNVTSATLGCGETLDLKATLGPKNTASTITYSSTDEEIATVKDNKIVAGDKPGIATISAAITSGASTNCTVTVLSAPAEISLGEPVTLSVGQTVTLSPAVQPSGAKDAVSYSTSNKKIATVTAQGVVKAVKTGTATITAKSYNGVEGSVQIDIVAAPSKVKLSATKASLGVGETIALEAAVTGGLDGKVSWTTSNAKIATVDDDGLVTAVKAGSATITAKTYNNKKATCKVTVSAAPEFITLSLTDVAMGMGETPKALKATLSKKSASAIAYDYDESVISLENGKIVPKAPGQTTITASTFNGLSAECSVTITAAPSSVDLGEDQSLKVKGTLTLQPQFQDGEGGTVTYKSSKTAVATVDANGKVTAKKAGTAVITVTTYNKVSDTVTITVTK